MSDGSTTTETSFDVEVVPVVDAPTIATIPSQTLYEDAEPARLALDLADVDTGAANLVVTARAENPGLIPASGLTVDGNGAGDDSGDDAGDVGDGADGAPTDDDRDGDGLSDADEAEAGTDPDLADTDGDGLKDGDEVGGWDSDPLLVDTDGDGIDDLEEIETWQTDPRLADTDEDGIEDGDEIAKGQDPLLGSGAPAEAKAFGCTSAPGGNASGIFGIWLLIAGALHLRRRRAC